jgi:hypothetical protein
MGDTAGMGRDEALALRHGHRLERCAHRLAQRWALCAGNCPCAGVVVVCSESISAVKLSDLSGVLCDVWMWARWRGRVHVG